MDSQYYEQLVPFKSSILMKILKVVSIIGIIISILFTAASLIGGLVGLVVMGVLFYFSNQEAGKEYEYVYVDGDISFDAIYNKARRKTKWAIAWDEIKLVCRADASELEGYRQKNAKIYNFTSKSDDDGTVYVLVSESGGSFTMTYFEPCKEMLEMMWRKSPSKVKR